MMQVKVTTRLILTSFLYVLACKNAIASHHFTIKKTQDKAVLDELRTLGVDVFDDHLVTADGSVFPKIKWVSKFEKDLSLTLHDPVKAKAIVSSYADNLEEALSDHPQLAARIQNWLIEHAYFLGSREHAGFAMLYEHNSLAADLFALLGQDSHQLTQFFDDIVQAEALASANEKIVDGDGSRSKTIAIVTTSGGGGHYTVATAMKELIRSQSPYQVKLIDFASLQFQCDALWVATGKYTSDMIYNQIFQQEHDTAKTNLYWSLYQVLEDYIPYRCHRLLKDQVKASGADLIISTMPHEDRHVDLAYSLDTPLRIVATDYQLAYSQFSNVLHASPTLVRYWLPADDREVFAGLANYAGDSTATQARRQRVAAYLEGKQSFAGLSKSDPILEVLGFPVRLAFGPSQHADEGALRQRLGIEADEELVILSMGRQGVGVLLDLVKELREYAGHWQRPVHIAVVCGKNKSMQRAIRTYLESSQPASSQLRFTVLGHLDEQGMANYFKIASSLISKPGGATTAEASAMKLPVLICHAHEWEECNKNYLLRHGLGASLNAAEPLALQLRQFLQQNLKQRSTFEPIAWQQRLLTYLHWHFAPLSSQD